MFVACLLLIVCTGCAMFRNSNPAASFYCSPTYGTAPLTVSFDASASYDTDGRIVLYKWAFGDDSIGYGLTAEHVFRSAGTFSVQLYVEDNNGGKSTAWGTTTVASPPPPSPPVYIPPVYVPPSTSEDFWDFVFYCQSHWQYEADLPGELCQAPSTSYLRMRGDCDDYAVMIAYYTQEYFGFDSRVYGLDALGDRDDHAVAVVRVSSLDTVRSYYSFCPPIPGFYITSGSDIYLPIDMSRCIGYGPADYAIADRYEWYELVGRPFSLSLRISIP